MSDARATLESSVLTAIYATSPTTRLTIDRCHTLVPRVIDEIFHPSVRWSVKAYLEELNQETSEERK